MLFNKNLSAIHAYLCADGYVIKNPSNQKHKYYHIALRNTCNALLLDFQKRFHEEFGVKPHMCKDGRCRIQNKSIYEELTKDYSYYSREWEMPQLDKRCLKVWLRAFFDCEGWVFVKSRQNRHIGLDSVNEKGLMMIKKRLEELNIQCIKKDKKDRGIYRLIIYGKNNIIKFQKEIGFLHPDKEKKLQEAINDYIDLNWKFPTESIEQKRFIRTKFDLSKNRIRVTSIVKSNIEILQQLLKELFNIETRIYDCGRYYELEIPKNDKNKLL